MKMQLVILMAAATITVSCAVNAGPGQSTAVAADTGQAVAPVSFEKDVQPIFDDYCVVCHQTGAAQEGLNLENGQAFASLVGIKSKQAPLMLVKPGEPDASYLLIKMEGTQAEHGGRGLGMPFGEGADEKSRATVRQWIVEGAVEK